LSVTILITRCYGLGVDPCKAQIFRTIISRSRTRHRNSSNKLYIKRTNCRWTM